MASITIDTRTLYKDPDATLDFTFDWTDWLPDGVTISSATVTAEDGVTIDTTSNGSDTVTVRFSGGTAWQNYEINCEVTLTNGEVDQATGILAVREQ